MLSPSEVLDTYFLDVRCMLLEIAATLDRLDTAANRVPESSNVLADPRLERIYQSLAILADRKSRQDRAETLLGLFSDPALTS